jgi:hypothetical protein
MSESVGAIIPESWATCSGIANCVTFQRGARLITEVPPERK